MPVKYSKEDFKNKIGKLELLLSTLKKDQADDLVKLGTSTEFITEAENSLNKVKQLDAEQEGIKASLKAKTAELDKEMSNMWDMYFKLKKKIKAEIKYELWKRYGIEDKH